MTEIQDPVYDTVSEQVLDPQYSGLCGEGIISPNAMTGAVLWLLRYHFSDKTRIVDDIVKRRVWTTDDDRTSAPDSKIVIEPSYRWDLDAIQVRPGIFVRRNQWGLQHLGMFGSRIVFNPDTDREIYTREVQGSHTIFSVSKLPAEAEAIAWELIGQLEGFSVNIGRDMGLVTLRVSEMQDLKPLQESEKHWTVPVVLSYIFDRSWNVHQRAEKFSKVTIGVQES